MALTFEAHRAVPVVRTASTQSWVMSNICDGEERRDRHER